MPARLLATAFATIALLACSSGSSTSTPPPPPGSTPPPTPDPCEVTGCAAGKYCDPATHLCRTGCATSVSCTYTGQLCESDHVCRCPTDQHVCSASCVSSTRARVYGAGTTYDTVAPALALDSGGDAHLATGDDDGILYHEPISATGWRTSFLYLYGNPPGNVSLALDALDQPHLAWSQTIDTDSIWYAH